MSTNYEKMLNMTNEERNNYLKKAFSQYNKKTIPAYIYEQWLHSKTQIFHTNVLNDNF